MSLSGLLIFACNKKDDNNNKVTPPAKKTYKVTYEIGCSDCEVIYYSDSLETSATEYHKNNSWTYTFYGKKGQTALLFAYNTSSVAQGVTATIKVNDSTTETQTNFCPVSGDAFVVDTL